MTTYNKATLKTFFETGDIPQGSDYANLIDSQVNIVETAEQDMAGALGAPKLITPLLSANNANITTLLQVNNVSAATVIASALTANIFSVTGAANFGADVSATSGTVYASAARINSGIFQPIAIVSAAGTTQATAAPVTATINRFQGATDGTATGIILLSPKPGLIQWVINEAAVSANLWPSVGTAINGGSTNAAIGMAAKTSYQILHSTASAYWVK